MFSCPLISSIHRLGRETVFTKTFFVQKVRCVYNGNVNVYVFRVYKRLRVPSLWRNYWILFQISFTQSFPNTYRIQILFPRGRGRTILFFTQNYERRTRKMCKETPRSEETLRVHISPKKYFVHMLLRHVRVCLTVAGAGGTLFSIEREMNKLSSA